MRRAQENNSQGYSIKIVLGFLSLCFLGLFSLGASAQQEDPRSAQQWIEAMDRAYDELNYRGQFIFEHAGGLNTLSIASQPGRAKLEYLDGPLREVLRVGNSVICILPGGRVLRFEHDDPLVGIADLSRNDFAKIGEPYQLELRSIERVAGREAIKIALIPRDKHRYGYRLWLDLDSAILIKSLMLDEQGGVLERVQFTSLDLGAELKPAELELSVDISKHKQNVIRTRSPSVAQGLDDESRPMQRWQLGWIPEGFSLGRRDLRQSAEGSNKVESMVFTDGLASFSVFVEEDDERVLTEVSDRNGATTAISRVFHDEDKYFIISVVGEVPLGTAERVAASIRPRQSL